MAVGIALGIQQRAECSTADSSVDAVVTVDEVIWAIASGFGELEIGAQNLLVSLTVLPYTVEGASGADDAPLRADGEEPGMEGSSIRHDSGTPRTSNHHRGMAPARVGLQC